MCVFPAYDFRELIRHENGFVFFMYRRPICQASELERKIKLCKDVPSLARRLGQGGGMMEMVAGEMMGENSDGPVRRKPCVCSAVR